MTIDNFKRTVGGEPRLRESCEDSALVAIISERASFHLISPAPPRASDGEDTEYGCVCSGGAEKCSGLPGWAPGLRAIGAYLGNGSGKIAETGLTPPRP